MRRIAPSLNITGGVRTPFFRRRAQKNIRPRSVRRSKRDDPRPAQPAEVARFTEAPVIIITIHGPDGAPLLKQPLTGHGPGLLLHAG